MIEIFKHSQVAADPEVRERCLDVLRKLVGDEYMTEGEGYIGIALSWKDDVVIVPGEKKMRKAVRVTGVMANTAGQQSGIMINDLIVKLEGEVWYEVDATAWFRERIKKMKPTSVASMTILRGGELVDLKVTLGRRPLMADHPQNIDLEASELAAKEAHFQHWLAQKKAAKGLSP
ncbi:MAG: PDZ domain-containing protein [Luteolibacter sp.]